MSNELDIYKDPNHRVKLFVAYRDVAINYLKKLYPEDDEDQIRNKVTKMIHKKCKELKDNLQKAIDNNEDITERRPIDKRIWPTIDVAFFENEYGEHSYGNQVRNRSYGLIDFVHKYIDKIITPNGCVYEVQSVKTSRLGAMLMGLKSKRKVEKNLMLEAKREGNKTKAQYHHNSNNSIKYVMNSVPGNMGAGYSILTAIYNFNAVTSCSRQIIMRAYSTIERFLEANFYFPSENDVLNFITYISVKRPAGVNELLTKYKLFKPTCDDVYEFLTSNLHKYMPAADRPNIRKLLERTDSDTLSFMFYMNNMFHLMKYNDSFFRKFFTYFFEEEKVNMNLECQPKDLFKIDSDLLIVISSMYKNEIPKNDKGNNMSIYETVDNNPELAKKLYRVGMHCQTLLNFIDPIFRLITDHGISMTNVMAHKHMFRYTVINSDTDSVLFTTKRWIEWFLNSLAVTDASLKMNALTVYFASKSNAYVMRHTSRAIGATGEDVDGMAMKNEFFMPVEIVTNLKKHYFSIVAMQEGVYYGSPAIDIKGVGFRGSDTCKATACFTKWLQMSIIRQIYTTGQITMKDKIVSVLKLERLVYDSVKNQEVTFLAPKPVKLATEYTDPDKSIFLIYSLWQEVFAEKYGDIVIPSKAYILPVMNLKSPQYLNEVRAMDPKIARKLQAFLDRYPNKIITYMTINPVTSHIPKELMPAVDIRRIVYDSTKPVHLAMSTMGLPSGSNKMTVIYSDVYGWVTEEDANDHKQYLTYEG